MRIKNIASNSINLERRNGELLGENQTLRNDLEVLTAENERLEASKESDVMLVGGALVLGGVLLALLIPMLKPTRKPITGHEPYEGLFGEARFSSHAG